MTRIRRLFAAALLLGTAAPLAAADPRPTDFDLALRAKTALAADSLLRSANLIVSVVDGVAVVGGPVESPLALERVAALLRTVPGLTDARASCWVASATVDPLAALLKARLPTTAVPREDVRPPATMIARKSEPRTMALLLDPTAPVNSPSEVYTPPAPPGVPPYPTIPPPSLPTTPAVSDFASDIERVRESESRFAKLTTRVQEGVVRIGGRARTADDAWDFARAVRQLPQVTRVVVGRIDER